MDFTDLYEQNVDSIYGYLAYRTRSRQAAEVLTQETFDRAMRARGLPEHPSQRVSTWLLTIARRVYADSRRGHSSEPRFDSADASPQSSEDGEGAGIARRLDPEIAQALVRLERREREAVALRFGGDLRSSEIAEVLGTSVASARQALSRALRRLRPTVLEDGAGA